MFVLKKSNKALRVAATAVAVICVGSAVVHAAAPADIIKTRQQGLKDMGAAFKEIRDQLKTGSPNSASIKASADTIQKTANAMENWFPKGTGPELGVKTAAKPEIWTDAATFATARKALVDASASFSQVAGGDAAAIGGGVRGLGMACKGCHDNFRVKED